MIKTRAIALAPLVLASALLASAGPSPLAGIALALTFVVAVVVGPRAPLDKPTQRLASLVIVILVIAAVRATGVPVRGPKLGAFAFGFAVAPLAVAAFRSFVARVEWGYLATSMLGFVAVMACGSARQGPLYGAFVAFYLATWLAALRSADAHRVPAPRLPRSAALASTFIVVLACGLAVSAALVIRPVAAYVEARVQRGFMSYMESKTDFSDTMRLGKMTRLLKSPRIVLRVQGARIERLRGASLDLYDGGRWRRVGGGQPEAVLVEKGPLSGADVAVIKKVGDETARLFLPFAMRAVATETGTIRVDGHGIGRAPEKGEAGPVWLRVADRRSVLPIAPFDKTDEQLTEDTEHPLRAVASDWARGARTPEEALQMIERRLRSDYAYALDSKRQTNVDPVLDFLFFNKVGHCEYFASSMTLLSRAIGIPARVVTGYIVSERNPYLGHWVVREHHAHAWVEAWIPQRGWVTFDPTPLTERPQDVLHDQEGLAALSEMGAAGAGRIEDWLAERTVLELAVAAVVGLFAFGVVRMRAARRGAPEQGPSRALAFSSPAEAWSIFEARLAREGTARDAAEPLEHFADRLPDEARRVLVRRYAAARYGGAVDEALEAELRRAAAAPP